MDHFVVPRNICSGVQLRSAIDCLKYLICVLTPYSMSHDHHGHVLSGELGYKGGGPRTEELVIQMKSAMRGALDLFRLKLRMLGLRFYIIEGSTRCASKDARSQCRHYIALRFLVSSALTSTGKKAALRA